MAKRDIIVVGASAGGVEALLEMVKTLPTDFDAAIFIVLHTAPYSPGFLPDVLNRKSAVEARYPADGEMVEPGNIYIAPPDHHLLIEDNKVIVRKGPKENRFRPSVDALFRSAAYCYGSRVIGVVLSGLLNDGTSGLWSIKRRGGIAVIQEDPIYDSMPQNVLEFVDVDYCVPANKVGELLERIVHEDAPEVTKLSERELKMMEAEVVIAAHDNAFEIGVLNMGKVSPITCPECQGALISFDEGKTVRFRCHTGHAFSASALLSGITKKVEDDMIKVRRGLHETAMLLEKISQRFEETGEDANARLFKQKAEDSISKSEILKDLALNEYSISEDTRFGNAGNEVRNI
jgi:two-component system, chemotaxis family, protein-glutamate methylesterase/glutaminase